LRRSHSCTGPTPLRHSSPKKPCIIPTLSIPVMTSLRINGTSETQAGVGWPLAFVAGPGLGHGKL
jgi:hypothetical protein